MAGLGIGCAHPGCDQPGEFKAPDPAGRGPGFDGPGSYRWLCFDHIREFNAGYNFFDGMSREEIEAAQRPHSGWEHETRAFARAGVDGPPRWADFSDPLEAISGRYRARRDEAKAASPAGASAFSAPERVALRTLGLDANADRRALRKRYSELVRRYHPDRNGGDRSFEKQLQAVVEAYQRLRGSAVFA